MPESIIEQTADSYPVSERNRVRRAHHRGSHKHQDVYDILDSSYMCHVGYVIDGQPYVTPTLHWRVGNKVYWHGSSASRMLKTATKGMPVSLTVTHFDGLVLARCPFDHSANYRCAMVFGNARAITDLDEKSAALDHMMEYMFPGRLAETRPNTEQELKATMVAVMEIEEASAKVRSGPPNDDEEDIKNIDCWSGVIPRREVWDAPVADELCRSPEPISDYFNKYRNEV
ncbi:MAG: pyridoxamine 5'-phosphate oxidase family protein [Alphaproteobacteria bacterium]|nr:pyridoxamine 5'-phosphate oxidase family protein [Alphaproteobacteria bacterium]